MKKHSLSIAAAGAAFIVATGCQTSPGGGAYLPQDTTKYNIEDTAKLALMDSRVQHSVTSPGIQETTLPDGRLEVVANLRNREERRIQVQVQCEFKDAQGFPIDSTVWQNVFLTENEQQAVKFVSMNDRAKRYTIRVREAH